VSDDEPLYKINVRDVASPGGLKAFCDMLEKHNYGVTTDLSNGRIEVWQAGDRSE
jgi:hypothetical protein